VAIWSAESLVLQGCAEEAIALTERLLASVSPTEPMVALLLRVRGLALAQRGDRRASEDALRRSLELARSTGADHDVAFALDALLRSGGSDGRAIPEMSKERDDLFDRLGIVAVPDLPLAAARA
jgi:hypothetical protein